jgi:hypothetical protein
LRVLLIATIIIVGSLSYFFNNSYASTIIDNFKTEQAIKKKQKIIQTNLTNYLNTVTKDGTASVSFYNLGAESGSAAANSKYAKLYQAGSLETESNAHAVKTAASTYKLYLTAYLMNQKSNGNFSWTTENTDNFDKMIVNSENDFAEAQIDKYGASTISTFIKKQGWYPSVFQDGQAAKTTSYSLQLLLEDLATGKGAYENESDQAKILDLMGKQIYRTGIPAGASAADSGTTVQDKVGFLNDTNNDAGIVTLPNGQRYILVVMTNGHNQSGLSGFSRIAEITKNVQKIVYGSDAGNKIENYS